MTQHQQGNLLRLHTVHRQLLYRRAQLSSIGNHRGFTIFGLLAIGRGLWIWRDNADGIAKLSVGQGTMFMIGGMLAYKVEVVHAFLASWFGLDFFKIIGLT